MVGLQENQFKSDYACKITFENNQWGIQSNNMLNEINYFSYTLIFLKSSSEYEKNQNSFKGIALEMGMKIFANGHIFNVLLL